MSLNAACKAALFCVMGFAGLSHVIAQVQTQEEAPRPTERKPSKIDFFFKASPVVLSAGTAVDVFTTTHNLDHPTTALRADGSVLTHYYVVEKGWARFLGDRNPSAVSLANATLNAGITALSRKLYLRGGRWRYAAVALVFAKAGANVGGGIQNEQVLAGIDRHVRLETGYKGVILWSR
jgi:hypothetical protein